MVQHSDCIGCQACVDFCPQKAISFQYDKWGEGRAVINASLCNNCGLCELRCPSLNNKFNAAQKTVFAAYSINNRHTGSSGGMFYELASKFIDDGGVVFGAAFDENLKLVHKKATNVSDLMKLCKSKYLHSDMQGIYNEIADCLKTGLNVMFVGTPCQVSAVKNVFAEKYEAQLLLIDFLCHGTGTQKCFDMCIKAEEKKQNGKIVDFIFRAKSRRAGHCFKYKLLRKDKEKTVAGYPFEFPYYYSFLKYKIFNEACYECQYARQERVGDITLGDFWGIRKYNKKLKDHQGISMLSVNTHKGYQVIETIRDDCVLYEHPIENASSNNEAFHSRVSSQCHQLKQELATILETEGEKALVEALRCKQIKKELIYAKTPSFIKRIWTHIKERIGGFIPI